MVRGLENIPRALLECVVRVHTAVCGRLSTRKGCHGWALFGDEQYMIDIYGDDDGKEKIQYIEKKKAVDEWEWIR